MATTVTELLGLLKQASKQLLFHESCKFRFYAAFLARAKMEAQVPGQARAWMHMQGVQLFISVGEGFKAMTESERIYTLVHEVEHAMRLHWWRCKEWTNHTLVNYACDMEINQKLSGLPPDCIYPHTMEMPDKLSAEQYCALLQKELEKPQSKPEKGKKKGGKGGGESSPEPKPEGNNKADPPPDGRKVGEEDKRPGTGMTKADHIEYIRRNGEQREGGDVNGDLPDPILEGIIKEHVREAVRQAGTCPAHIRELIEEWDRLEKVDWRTLLRRYAATAFNPERESTWTRFHRRGLFTPGRKRQHTYNVVFCLDTSGSMASDELLQAVGECRGLLRNRTAKLHVIMADAAVAWAGPIEHMKDFPEEFKGRGGTSFIPAFEYIHKHKLAPDLVVYFTDADGTFPKKVPYRVIWLLTCGDRTVPFGTKIELPR